MPQTLTQLYIHAVFTTKERAPLIGDPVHEPLRAYLGGILRNLKSPSIEIGMVSNHVHILFSLSKTLDLADAMEELKASSSKWMKTQGPEYAKFAWQRGYSGFTVSASRIPAVRQYLRDQKKHHAKLSFEDELRQFYREYGIEWDENHVWD